MPVFIPRDGSAPVFTAPLSVPVEEVSGPACCLVCGLETTYMVGRPQPGEGLCGWCWGRGWTLVDPPMALTERVLKHGVPVDLR